MATAKQKSSKRQSAPKRANERKESKPRKVQTPQYQTLRLHRRIKHPGPRLTSAYRLFKQSFQVVWKSKKLFLGIVAVYFVLSLVLVKGLALTNDTVGLKEGIEEVLQDNDSELLAGVALFSFMVQSSGSAEGQASVYQLLLLIVVSLALIWAIRQIHAGERISVRDAFYKGLYPLAPFVLVLMVIGLQLFPLIAGNGIYKTVVTYELAITWIEKAAWIILYGLLALLSFYMITSSIFALYIVTLPEMTPMKALRSARELVRHRRGQIMRKLIFLPVLLMLITALIVIPLIIYAAPVAQLVFFILSLIWIVVFHSYIYMIYRELL